MYVPRRTRAVYVQLLLAVALLLLPLPARAQSPTPGAPVTATAPLTPLTPLETPLSTPGPGTASASPYTVGQCANADRDTLRAEIQSAALAVVGSSTSTLDIDALVDRKWNELGVDAVVDAEVARAVQNVANEESYWSRLLSGWSADKAQEFATRISADAFGSAVFTGTISALSSAIGDEIARQVNAQLAAAASTAFLCLRDYVGTTYSTNLFSAFEQSVGASIAVSGSIPSDLGNIDIGIIDTHGGLITGAGIIVITEVGSRVAVKLSEQLAERVAGKILTRVIGRAGSTFLPVAGWVVGIALIAWDLVQGGKGALPEIQKQLTNEEVKARIRKEVADAVRAGLPEEAAITSLETAIGMVDAWETFCTRYANVCTLAEENTSFRALLNDLPLTSLDRLQALAQVFLDDLGRSALDQAIDTGDFDKLLALPPAGDTILADTASAATTLAWAQLAGPDLPIVAAIGIHRFAPPEELTRDRLDKLLAWNDGVAVRKFLLLDAPDRALLWPLGGQTLFDLVAKLDDAGLSRLAQGLALWPAADRARIAGDYLAGARSQAEVAAGPTPVPAFTLQAAPSAAATARAGATGTPAALAGATAATPAGGGPATPLGSTDPITFALLGALVMLLAAVAAFMLLRHRPRQGP